MVPGPAWQHGAARGAAGGHGVLTPHAPAPRPWGSRVRWLLRGKSVAWHIERLCLICGSVSVGFSETSSPAPTYCPAHATLLRPPHHHVPGLLLPCVRRVCAAFRNMPRSVWAMPPRDKAPTYLGTKNSKART